MPSQKLLWLILAGLASLSLSGCSTNSPTKEYITVYDDVPVGLLNDCPGYTGVLVTNGDLAKAYKVEKQARILCNTDKSFLRDWLSYRPTNQPKK